VAMSHNLCLVVDRECFSLRQSSLSLDGAAVPLNSATLAPWSAVNAVVVQSTVSHPGELRNAIPLSAKTGKLPYLKVLVLGRDHAQLERGHYGSA
jgi:hypothetical protein